MAGDVGLILSSWHKPEKLPIQMELYISHINIQYAHVWRVLNKKRGKKKEFTHESEHCL